jgi:hypothetical protein
MKKFLYKILAFFSIVMVISVGIDYYLTNHFFKNWANCSYYQKDYWVLQQKDRHYNYAICGTSRAFHHVKPELFHSFDSNLSCINIGSDGTSHGDHFLQLYYFLKNGNTIDTVLLEVDEFTLSSSETATNPFKDYVFLPEFRNEPTSQVYSDYMSRGKNKLWQLPLVRYIEYNNYFKLNRNTIVEDRFENTYGYEKSIGDKFDIEVEFEKMELKISDIDIQYLNKIIDLCQDSGIVISLFSAPVLDDLINVQTNRDTSYNFITELAADQGIDFHDFSQAPELRDTVFFTNYSHLKDTGSEIFTKMLYDRIHER